MIGILNWVGFIKNWVDCAMHFFAVINCNTIGAVNFNAQIIVCPFFYVFYIP